MKKLFIGSIVIVSIFATSAQAQMTGSRLGKNAGAEDADKIVEIVVECVAGRRGPFADRVMRALPGSAAESKLLVSNEGDFSICMDDDKQFVTPGSAELRFTPRAFRIALARTLARKELRKIQPADLKNANPWSLASYDVVDTESTGDAMQLGLYQFGDCVVNAQPIDAANLVLAKSGTSEANKATKKLMSALGPCLTEGVELKLTQDLLASAFAEPVYHRARALDMQERK